MMTAVFYFIFPPQSSRRKLRAYNKLQMMHINQENVMSSNLREASYFMRCKISMLSNFYAQNDLNNFPNKNAFKVTKWVVFL